MIRALKRPSRTSLFATNKRASMRAGIKQHSHLIIIASYKDHRATGHSPRPKVSRVRNLRLVPRIDPTMGKDSFSLQRQDVLIGERLTIDAKPALSLVVYHQSFKSNMVHNNSPVAITVIRAARSQGPHFRHVSCNLASHKACYS